ncbi:molybdopterin molybdenumtransferase [Actinoalloteichus sp. AHMU CJ021]|uniref:molybdopterin molybdotransferase MoeA n=1 Tax=Actinoalloteichus TaxID=65496 RepID=UPI000CA0238C|nr:molybdopterin molybdenumtransferase [Actinoalloteichus sp. AHMU CJ021]
MAQDNRTPPLVPVEEHQEHVASLLRPTEVTRSPLEECAGLAMARDLVASIPLPPFRNSAMDGYAVRSVDVAGASPDRPVRLPVTADLPAGAPEVLPLAVGSAQRIMTGAPLPLGADCVVPVEHTDGGTREVAIGLAPEEGRHVRRAGEDVPAGTTVLRRGSELGPAQLGLASALGFAELPVRRRPRVVVLSTGSELVEPGEPLGLGQIYESNAVMLVTAVREAGGHATAVRFVPDDVGALHEAVRPHLADADLLLTTGGVSAGAYEVVKDALAGEGVTFTKVAMQPGMPQGSGRYRGVPVVALPGNPVSALVSFEVFVRPALRRAAGFDVTDRPRSRAVLEGAALSSPSGKRQYRRGSYHLETGAVRVVGAAGSHLLSALAESNCLVEIAPEVTVVEPDTPVEVLLLGGPSRTGGGPGGN